MDATRTESTRTCTACNGEFDLQTEGGIEGNFGILPMAFCPTCYASMMDMAQQCMTIECPHCGKDITEDPEEPNDEIPSS